MKAHEVKTIEDAKQIVQSRKLKHVKVGVFDIDGVLRGKYMKVNKFLSALESGFGFCDVVVGWDSDDQLYDNVQYTGWHTGYPDAPVRILPESCREITGEDTLLFLGEFSEEAETICPRGTLKRVLKKASGMGYNVKAALEYEFFVFDETPDSVREKNFQNLKPITPGNFGYSVIRNSTHADLYHEILDMAEEMDFSLESFHTETGPGVLEAAIAVDDALNAADKAALFKTFIKVLMQQNDMIATFMAKWSPKYPGQSGHIHLSLFNDKNKSVFYDSTQPYNMSEIQHQCIAGQQKLMPELLAMIAPTINSYTRMVPGFWAPTNASWGAENRTGALRVISGNAKSQRIEYRLAAADANPYIALAAAIGSALIGIENKWEPTEMLEGNAYEQTFPESLNLPKSLGEAAASLKQSKVARELFGDGFVDHFSATRDWEEREFRKHITDWELQRYFEII